MPKTKRATVIRLSKAEIIQQRDMQVRGEALGMAAQYVGQSPNRIDDIIRGAGKIEAFLRSGRVPSEATLVETLGGKATAPKIGIVAEDPTAAR